VPHVVFETSLSSSLLRYSRRFLKGPKTNHSIQPTSSHPCMAELSRKLTDWLLMNKFDLPKPRWTTHRTILLTSGFFVFSQLNSGWQCNTRLHLPIHHHVGLASIPPRLESTQVIHIIETGDMCLPNPASRQLDIQKFVPGKRRTIDQCKPLS
jgi:hypothetical protein